MGLAIDSIALYYTTATTAPAAFEAMTVASGDSLTVRSFASPASAMLFQILYSASTKDAFRLRSPLLHDNVQGIRVEPGESPAQFLMPLETGQPLHTQDTLIAEINAATASATHAVVLENYYTDLGGASARLHSWGDISGLIKNLKPVEVACTGIANAWVDTVITTTENLLHANTDYAVLGISVDTACCAVGIKGIETGNLRVCLPGVTRAIDQSDGFIVMSSRYGTPHIPVINSANAASLYVSLFSDTAVSPNVQLMLAELSQNLPN